MQAQAGGAEQNNQALMRLSEAARRTAWFPVALVLRDLAVGLNLRPRFCDSYPVASG